MLFPCYSVCINLILRFSHRPYEGSRGEVLPPLYNQKVNSVWGEEYEALKYKVVNIYPKTVQAENVQINENGQGGENLKRL